MYFVSQRISIFIYCQNSEQERGISPSLPDSSTFGVNSPTDGTNKSQKDPK